ncbi:MAG: hypothetical protein ABIP20_17710 [Chthoniobacteraceae bacterium]
MKTLYLPVALFAIASSGCSSLSPNRATMTQSTQKATTPGQALQKLKDGNARFVSGRSVHRNYLAQVIHPRFGGQQKWGKEPKAK